LSCTEVTIPQQDAPGQIHTICGLVETIGAPMALSLCHAQDEEMLQGWCRKETPVPLMAQAHAESFWATWSILAQRYPPNVCRTWFARENPNLGYTSPIRELRLGNTENVINAAYDFRGERNPAR
jgi:hypothetical protein